MKPGTPIIVTRGDLFTGRTGVVVSVTVNGKLWCRLDCWPDGVRRVFSGERCDEMCFEVDEVEECSASSTT